MDFDQYIPKLRKAFLKFEENVPDEELHRFLKICKPTKIKAGAHYIEAGTNATSFAFVMSGLFKYYYTTFDGKEFIQAFKDEYEFMLSYYPVMTGKPSPFGVQAIENSEILIGDYRELEQFYVTSQMWNNVARKFYQLNFIRKVEREFDLLLYDATQRYEKFIVDYKDLLPRLTKQQIAMFLGISPVSLSRIINK